MSIITISRGTFSGGKQLAECIAEKLGYKCISREVLVRAARGHGVPLDELSRALVEPPGGIFHRTSLRRVHYLVYVQEELVKAVQDERAIYHGLAGQLLLRDVPHVLRVKVIANMEFRIQAAMDRLRCGRHEAVDFIKNIDKKRDRWVRYLYDVDRNDLSLYDLIVNLDRMDIASACEIVCATASQEEFQPTPESQKRLRDLVLSAEVRARIASDGSIQDDNVEVKADDGVVTIRGVAHSPSEAGRIGDLARQAPGVKDVNSEIQTHG